MEPILICTDLDRTLLPNGAQSESPGARPRLTAFVSRPEVRFAFVSGRRLSLQKDAIQEYGLPTPDYIVGDVGASIHQRANDGWEPISSWHETLASAWNHRTWKDIAPLLSGIDGLELQDQAAQADHKLSFNVPNPSDRARVVSAVEHQLNSQQVPAQLIWSVDETVQMGLLDVMAPGATKLHAVEHVIEVSGVPESRVLYAGDSGNDLPILVSPFPSVLVANATPEFRQEVSEAADAAGTREQLYLAEGNKLGLNGCYSAGILEGLAHFFPETLDLVSTPTQIECHEDSI
jgi:HAD superfamily hydrolase (TIGR01484 family)